MREAIADGTSWTSVTVHVLMLVNVSSTLPFVWSSQYECVDSTVYVWSAPFANRPA